MRLEEVRIRLFPFFFCFILMSFTEFLNSQRKVRYFLSKGTFLYMLSFFSLFLLVGMQ